MTWGHPPRRRHAGGARRLRGPDRAAGAGERAPGDVRAARERAQAGETSVRCGSSCSAREHRMTHARARRPSREAAARARRVHCVRSREPMHGIEPRWGSACAVAIDKGLGRERELRVHRCREERRPRWEDASECGHARPGGQAGDCERSGRSDGQRAVRDRMESRGREPAQVMHPWRWWPMHGGAGRVA
ncbi:hypothetical protein PHLGIDRAFT_420888 [Phlebiopsis gigantea 11061_1 CR5-6]|uniref:Uncharacterized protein n=1 Tax=Phlebiopsis gigantea (strain 11061_1 CR5-6) TaxID=745531 RepID=A0A0C3SAY0_PHLG1|nr:hypothetical protein PHLGIDRAFT_420888 [Phlebiopsis gigantea 11061_1 CR5-6]